MNAGQWQIVVLLYDQQAGEFAIYVDDMAQPVATESHTADVSTTVSISPSPLMTTRRQTTPAISGVMLTWMLLGLCSSTPSSIRRNEKRCATLSSEGRKATLSR